MILLMTLAAVALSAGVAVLAVRRLAGNRGLAVRVAVGFVAGLGTMVLFIGLMLGLLFVSLTEPWPVSLRHGPDTDYAREQFGRYVGPQELAAVAELYAWRQWAGPGEHVFFACFVPRDTAVKQRIVSRFSLARVEATERAKLSVWEEGPHWWPHREALHGATPMYRDPGRNPQAYTVFWPRVGDGRACLLEVDIA